MHFAPRNPEAMEIDRLEEGPARVPRVPDHTIGPRPGLLHPLAVARNTGSELRALGPVNGAGAQQARCAGILLRPVRTNRCLQVKDLSVEFGTGSKGFPRRQRRVL